MPSPDDSLEYSPEHGLYIPETGSRQEDRGIIPPSDGMTDTYANVNYIRQLLDALLLQIQFATSELEVSLNRFSLAVTDTIEDTQLRQANEVEWPTSLGTPKNYVTYNYYKSLSIKDTKSAAYIRHRYEDAVRDLTGNNAIDLLKLLDIVRDEAFLAQGFLDTYMGNLDDTAEFRAAEQLQDWAENATVWTTRIQAVFENEQTGQLNALSDDEINQITPEDARKAQALFKVKMNSLNDEIGQSLGSFKKSYADYADVFFSKFLGPALNFRLDVSRTIYPTTGMLGDEMFKAAGSLDSNFTVALSDQLRRNKIFADKMNEVLTLVRMRDTYRGYIQQLAPKGVTVPRGGSGTTIDARDSADEFDAFRQALTGSPDTTTNRFESSHQALDGRLAGDAHPQYILSDGGNVSGDITVDSGKKIDGISLSGHRHTGKDGSAQIDGKDIIFGTIPGGAFDTSTAAPKPENLRVISQKARALIGGGSIVDVVVAWDSPDNLGLVYETNIAPV